MSVPIELAGTITGSKQEIKSVVSNGPDGNGFTRFDLIWENPSANGNFSARIKLDTSGDICYVWVPQVEAGVNILFATEPIPGNALTRNAERLSYSNTGLFNQNKGSICLRFNPLWQTTPNTGSKIFFDVGSPRFIHFEYANSIAPLVQMKDSTGANINAQASNTTVNQNSWDNFIAITYDTTIVNGIKIYENGILIKQSSNSVFSPQESYTGQTIELGASVGGGFNFAAALDEFLI